MAMPQNHKTAKRHLTKSEFKLFQNSLPKNITGLNPRRVKSAHKNTLELIKKYRKGLKNASEAKSEKINLRLKNLEQVLDRYSRNMKNQNEESDVEGRRALTGQAKMRLRGDGGSRQQRLHMERNKISPMNAGEGYIAEKPLRTKTKWNSQKPKGKRAL